MNIIKHDLPVYYNPEYNGFHVVHSINNGIAVVGNCCRFYNDAYTTIVRNEIPKEYLNKWILLDKNNLLKYDFICKKYANTIHVVDIDDGDDLKRSTWYSNSVIINNYYIR